MLGYTLRLIRIANDISIKEVAIKTNISPSFICEIEKNKKKPSLELLNKLSQFYEIPSSKIIELCELAEIKCLSYQKLLIKILEYYLSESYEYSIDDNEKVMKL